MLDSRLLLVEPLFREADHSTRRFRCGERLTLLTLLIGVALVMFLSLSPGSYGVRGSAPQDLVNLAHRNVQPVRAQRSLPIPPVQVWRPMQPPRAREFIHPVLAWQSVFPSKARQSLLQAVNEPVGPVESTPAEEEPAEEPERLDGMVMHWNIDKGYGFIMSAEGEKLFCHLTSVIYGNVRNVHKVSAHPCAGDRVKYIKHFDEKKQTFLAKNVTVVEANRRGHHGEVDDEMLVAPWGELNGVVTHWNAKKGFGFIAPEGKNDELFVHLASLVGMSRLMVNDTVSYNVQFNERSGKDECIDVRLDRDRLLAKKAPAKKAKKAPAQAR